MTEDKYSDEIRRQTQLAWDYIEKAKPLINYIKLVPVSEQQIAEYEEYFNKTVPPDYRYWLTTYGSGRIDFSQGSLLIPSVYDLVNDFGQHYYEGAPKNYEKRVKIVFGLNGAIPDEVVLDSSIIEESGCAPVIQMSGYTQETKKVLSSSWPMYAIAQIIAIAGQLKSTSYDSLNEDQIKALDSLLEPPFESIDQRFEIAQERVDEHAKTISDEVDDQVELKLEFIKRLLPLKPNSRWNGLIPDFFRRVSVIMGRDDDLRSIVSDLEQQILLGYSRLVDHQDFFKSKKVGTRHEKLLRQLLQHDRRDMRELAETGLKSIIFWQGVTERLNKVKEN